MDTGKLSTYTIIAFVVGIVLGYLVAWGIYATPAGEVTEENGLVSTSTPLTGGSSSVISDEVGGSLLTPTVPTGTTPALISVGAGETIAVMDQAAGQTVEVDGVTSAGVTWVAVREYANNQLGNILGARRIPGGDGQTVMVELLRPTIAGRDYAVVLYRDNGDLAFNHRTDSLVVEDELPVMEVFAAN
jgi:hypothetical protein